MMSICCSSRDIAAAIRCLPMKLPGRGDVAAPLLPPPLPPDADDDDGGEDGWASIMIQSAIMEVGQTIIKGERERRSKARRRR